MDVTLAQRPGLLCAEHDGKDIRLLSPMAGFFAGALPKGQIVVPGQEVGTLVVLERAVPLWIPDGCGGVIANERSARVREPVGFKTVLYVLQASPPSADTATVHSSGAQARSQSADHQKARGDVLAVRSAQAGRFYHRPAPADPAFAPPGTVLSAGTSLGLIEVMKTFMHVTYPSGAGLPARARAVRYVAGDGAEVAEGDELLEIEPV